MFLVINLGLKSIRGIVFSENGRKIYSQNLNIQTNISGEFIEQDPYHCKQLLFKILENLKKKGITKRIKYISTTTSSGCLLLLDKKKQPCSKVVTILDARCKNLTNLLNKKKNQFKYEMQLVKVLWFKKNKSKIFKKSKYWVNNGDYLNMLFANKIFTDELNYNKFIIKNKSFTNKFLKKHGLNKECLPKKTNIGEIFNLDQKIIKKFNFHSEAKLIVTTYDAICATIGSINNKSPENNASEVSGTVTSVRAITKKKPKKIKNLHISYIPLIRRYFIGASNNLGGGIFEWYKSFLSGKENYKNIELSFKKSKENIFFLPLLFGDRYLGIDRISQGLFYGIGRSTNIHDLTKGVVESSALITKLLINDIEKSGIKIKSITLSGGLTRLNFVNFVKYEIYRKRTFLCKEFESTSLGCLILMLKSIKKNSFEKIIKIIRTIEIKKKYQLSQKKNSDKIKKFNNLIEYLKHFLKNDNNNQI